MNRLAPYLLLAVWSSVATVLQGLAVEVLGFGVFAPDLPLFLLVAALGQLYRSDAVRVSLVAGLARASFTVEPPFAILAGTLAVGLVADTVRRIADLSRPLTRSVLVGAAAFGLGLWLRLVDTDRATGVGARDLVVAVEVVPTAISSALLALVAWRAAQALPGLRRIERRAF